LLSAAVAPGASKKLAEKAANTVSFKEGIIVFFLIV
jgi:hypothetical protein